MTVVEGSTSMIPTVMQIYGTFSISPYPKKVSVALLFEQLLMTWNSIAKNIETTLSLLLYLNSQ